MKKIEEPTSQAKEFAEEFESLEAIKERAIKLGLFDRAFLDSLEYKNMDATGEGEENPEKDAWIVSREFLRQACGRNLGPHKPLHRIPFIWWPKNDVMQKIVTFDSTVVHEIAHPKSYRIFHPEREEFDSSHFRKKINKLVQKNDRFGNVTEIDFDRFKFSVYEWSEIYALLYQREFLRSEPEKGGANIAEWDKHIYHTTHNIEQSADELGKEFNLEIDPGLIYQDPHSLSIILANVIEETYPDFDQRIEYVESLGKNSTESRS